MSAWCGEKATHVVQGLARIIDELRHRPQLDPEMLEAEIGAILGDATKILSFAAGADWSLADPDTIMRSGYEGYEEIAVKYGVLHETTGQRRLREVEEKVKEFEPRFRELVEGPRVPGRTMLHELLARTTIKNPQVTGLADLTEQVTMGEIEWEEFQRSAALLLDRLREMA